MTDGKPGSANTSGWFMAMLLSALLAGCGGGGGGGDTTTTVSGTAASGKPIISGTVEMVCFNNAAGTAVTTGADGGFTVTAAGSAPCVIRVSGGTNNTFGPLISIVASSSQTRVNVNQLTHMLAALLAGANPDSGLFQLPSSLGGKITAAAVATHKATIIASEIAPRAAAAGISTSFDFLEGTFTANSTGFDLLLDKLGLSSTAVPGAFSITFNGLPSLSVNTTTGVITPSSTGVISTATLAAAGPSGTAAAPATAKAITAYSFAAPAATGTITEAAKTIAVTVPNGTNVTALVATFTAPGASVMVGTTAQTSGTTANNFTSPVAYIVTAADGTTATYTVTVTVTVAASSAKAITAYSFTAGAGTINEPAKTIAVTVPNATNVTALVATFTTTGASVMVGTTPQTSATTPNNFTSPVAYIVTAADATTATYNVTVTVDPAPNLRSTASFAVLGSSITNTGTTTVIGNVGALSLTGAALGVTGTNDPTCATQACMDARTDLPLVIADATSTTLFPCGPTIAGGDLATVFLTPGVTCITSDAAIANTGIVTLNGPGVYIIRTNAALTAAAGSSVAYSGGATDANTSVFWVVTSVSFTSTAGSPVTWKGTLLATTGAVTLGDSATLIKGRVFSTVAVTLTNNTITKP